MTLQRCQQSTGFKIEQPCPQPGDAYCRNCQKLICKDHARLIDARILCMSCIKIELARNLPAPSTSSESALSNTHGAQRYYFVSEFDEQDRAQFDAALSGAEPDELASGDDEFEQDFDGS
jgi:hypothetical protein